MKKVSPLLKRINVAVTRELLLLVIRPVLRIKPLDGGFYVPWFSTEDAYILTRGHGFIPHFIFYTAFSTHLKASNCN